MISSVTFNSEANPSNFSNTFEAPGKSRIEIIESLLFPYEYRANLSSSMNAQRLITKLYISRNNMYSPFCMGGIIFKYSQYRIGIGGERI